MTNERYLNFRSIMLSFHDVRNRVERRVSC